MTSLLCLYNSAIIGQITPLESLTAEDGLSQGMIFDITKDQDGFMWFATKDGLNRYDGHTFKVFRHNAFDSTSVPSNEISGLFVDSKNRLWTLGSLSVYDKNSEQFQRVPGFSDALNLIEDKEGNLWGGNRGSGSLVKITEIPAANTTNPQFKVENKGIATRYAVNFLHLLSDGTILAGGHRGLLKWNEKANQLEPFVNQKLGQVNSIVEYPKGTLWVKSNYAFHKIQNGIVTPIQSNVDISVTRIKFDTATHKIWFYYGGPWLEQRWLFGINPLKIKDNFLDIETTEQIILEKKLYAPNIFLEEGRTIWIGTNGYGIRKMALQKYPFRHFLPENSPRDLRVREDGKVVAEALTNYVEDSQNTIIPNYDSRIGEKIGKKKWRVLTTKAGKNWILIEKKIEDKYETFLNRYDEAFQLEKSYPIENLPKKHGLNVYMGYGSTKCFIDGNKNCFWWGTSDKGLIKFDLEKEAFEFIENKQEKETGKLPGWMPMYQDKTGNIWMIPEGLVKVSFDKTGKATFQRYKNDPTDVQSLSSNVTLCVHDDLTDPDTYLWVGTKGSGLNKMNKKTGKFQHFTTKDGLPDNVVYGILPDDEGNFWLSTNRGLSKFNPTTETFTNFVKADGLQDDEFNTNSYARNEKTGELFFGGINGITAFHPKDIKLSTFEPKVQITQLKIHGEIVELGEPLEQRGKNPLTKPIEFTEKIRLPWYQNQITLDFTALDFTNPKKNQYQYQLSSVNKDWVDAGTDHKVNYANLSTGIYTFRVRGTNSDGVWSSKETVLKIVIYPPWYRTNLAYVIYAILLIFGVYKLYQDQVRRAKLRNELEFEQKEAARLVEMDKIKTNFFSNITHEFRTPLTLIIEPLNQVLDKEVLNWKPKVELARRNSQRLLGLVNQLLDLSKLESKKMNLELKRGDLLVFVAPIMASFAGLAKKKEIELIYNAPEKLPFFDFDKNKVEKILYNLISNAIKFAKTNGTITINIIEKTTTNQIQIQVIDTGIGIAKAEQPHIFDRFYQVDGSNTREHEGTGIGLALSKELAEVMNGQLTFQSEIGQGSTFEVFIPMVKEATNSIVSEEKVVSMAAASPVYRSNTIVSTLSSHPIKINPDATNIALIIEDNDELRAFIKSSIEHKYQVIEANNGRIGLELALEHIPNINISHVMMTIMDGFEVCQKVKTNEKTAHIPVILLTAKTAMDSRIQGLKYGADAYMNKPFSTEELLIRMNNLIEIRRKLQQKFSQTIETIPSNLVVLKNTSAKNTILIDDNLSTFDKDFLININQFIEQHIDNEKLSIEEIAQAMTMSRTQLYRKLRALLNQSPSEFLRNFRLKVAKEFLQQQKGNVTEVAFMVGFSSSNYFSTKFKEKYGISPKAI